MQPMQPMSLLFEGRIEDFLRAGAIGKELCLFVHVPKTAGTSLRAELAGLLQPDVNIAVDYRDESRSFHERMDDAVSAFVGRASSEAIRFASGHIQERHVARIRQAIPSARLVTMLRDPVARVVSDYRHQRSVRHPGHKAFSRAVPSLEAYLAIPGERNKAAQHLVPASLLRTGDPAACIDHVMRSYTFVGIQEMYDTSFRVLTALLGRPRTPRLRENVNTDSDGEPQLDADMKAAIAAANSLDVAIYLFFARKLIEVEQLLLARLHVQT